MNTITAEEFQAACMAVLEQVRATRQPVRITLNGTPIAEITPPAEEEAPKAPKRKRTDGLGSMAHCTKIHGDITVPSSELVRWEAPDD